MRGNRYPYKVITNKSHVKRLQKVIRPLPCKSEGDPYVCSSRLLVAQQPPTNLLPLIGREQEIRTLSVLLRQPQVRLLTLAGPGGVGKTRLALQVVTEVSSAFADGVFFVSFASISACDQVLPAIAQALGLDERADDSPLAQVQAALQERKFLLFLDNFEHVVDAAPQLKELLAGCSHLKILVTSRIVLKLLEEWVFSVAPLTLPDPAHLPVCEDLSQVAAVSLFLQRARAIYPDFELTSDNASVVAQICVRLDGLPLALELAATRMKLFSSQDLLTRLERPLSFLTAGTRDAPERQQTLRKAIEWSYSLLTPEEQRLFRSLSVFVGGCTLQAIEFISHAAKAKDELLLDTLTSLLDQSLLQREIYAGKKEQRFTMLETIREYAWECLQVSGEEEAMCQAHAEYYITLAKTVELKMISGEQASWIEWIESDFENLRKAFSWLSSSQNGELVCETDTRLPLAMCLVGMGIRVAARKQYAWALYLWGKANNLLKIKDDSSPSGLYERVTTILCTHSRYAQIIQIVRNELGEQVFNAMWKKGQSMTLKHVLTEPEQQTLPAKPSLPEKAPMLYSDELTSREKEVLYLLSQGLSSALIARQLVISLTTVNSHIRTIYNKLGVSCRSAATRYAIEHHLV